MEDLHPENKGDNYSAGSVTSGSSGFGSLEKSRKPTGRRWISVLLPSVALVSWRKVENLRVGDSSLYFSHLLLWLLVALLVGTNKL